jgi:hypothetical protein
MLAVLLLIGPSDVFGGICGTIARSDAFVRRSSLCTGTYSKPTKAGDLVLVGTVTETQPLSARRSRKNWVVVLHVDRVVSGEFSGSTFEFAVHSPAQSGLEVGRSCTVKATWTGEGYVVDEAQWRNRR